MSVTHDPIGNLHTYVHIGSINWNQEDINTKFLKDMKLGKI